MVLDFAISKDYEIIEHGRFFNKEKPDIYKFSCPECGYKAEGKTDKEIRCGNCDCVYKAK